MDDMILALILTIVFLAISCALLFVSKICLDKAEDNDIPRYWQGIAGVVAGAVCSLLGVLFAFTILGTLVGGDSSENDSALSAQCNSVEGTKYGGGHCYKNGVELIFGDNNE